jgi:Concanavalin A-like lectin/glucanases superfamily
MRFHPLLFLFPLLALMTLAAPHIARADITTGLISHWMFDNSLTDSTGTRHGTFSGGTPSYQAGKIGQALTFDGIDDEVDIPDYNPNGTNFSVGGWVTISANSDYQPIAGNNQNTPLLGYRPSTHQVVTFIQDSSGSQTITWNTTSLENTGWHHVMLVSRDGSTDQVEAFVDGVSLGLQAITSSYTANNGSFRKMGNSVQRYAMLHRG